MNSGNSGNFLNCLKSWIYQFVVDVCLLVMRYIKLKKIQKIKEIYTLRNVASYYLRAHHIIPIYDK